MSLISLGRTTLIKIIRKWIYTFFHSYNHFKIASLLTLPFSLSIILLLSFSPDFISFQQTIHFRLQSLFWCHWNPNFISILLHFLPQTLLNHNLSNTTPTFISKNQQKYELINKNQKNQAWINSCVHVCVIRYVLCSCMNKFNDKISKWTFNSKNHLKNRNFH